MIWNFWVPFGLLVSLPIVASVAAWYFWGSVTYSEEKHEETRGK